MSLLTPESTLAVMSPTPATTPIPPGYKQTEIGIIPEDWGTFPLYNFVEINSGESPSKFNFTSHGIPYFKVEQLNNDLKYLSTTPYFLETGRVIQKGSIIFPKRGASILLNKIRILQDDSFMDTNLMTLTINGNLNNEFLYYYLDFRGLSSVADTTSIPQINNKHIYPFLVPVPRNPEEQKLIAEALSDVDALIASLEGLIAKKRDIKTATMQQLLTGKQRLPGFGEGKGYKQTEIGIIPEDWEVRPLGELLDFQGGSQPDKKFFKTIAKPGYIRLIQIRDYKTDKFETFIPASLARKFCNETDIMIGRYGPPIFQILKGIAGAYNVALIKAIPFDTFNQDYAYHFLKQEKLFYFVENLSQRSSGQTGVDLKELKKYPLPLSCNPDEQKRIAEVLSDVDEELAQLEARLAKTRDLKQGMMQELLTGRTRLI